MGPRSDGRRAVAVGICDAGTAASGHPDRAVRSVRWAVGLGTELEDSVALGASPPTARGGPTVGTRAKWLPDPDPRRGQALGGLLGGPPSAEQLALGVVEVRPRGPARPAAVAALVTALEVPV